MDEAPKRTPLYDRHRAMGARMIPFAGWMMPVQYEGIIAEHQAVRNRAGLFDLGHMGQVEVTGPDALEYLQYATTNDAGQLEPGDAQYSMLTNRKGGVIDDIIVYRYMDRPGYMVVLNAANHAKDVDWLNQLREERNDLESKVKDISDRTGMIAIQGPNSEQIVQSISSAGLGDLGPFRWRAAEVGGVPAMVARTGYTGEDGFEFYCPIERVGKLWDALMQAGSPEGLAPVGLGARDTLRLEARMPLYGNELADDICPLEAGLGWAVKLDKGQFVGSEPIREMKARGVPRKTVGFRLIERAGSPRSHYSVLSEGREVGFVTSGAFSPTLQENIGLALVQAEAAGVGKPLQIVIRNRPVDAEQIKLPFYRRASR